LIVIISLQNMQRNMYFYTIGGNYRRTVFYLSHLPRLLTLLTLWHSDTSTQRHRDTPPFPPITIVFQRHAFPAFYCKPFIMGDAQLISTSKQFWWKTGISNTGLAIQILVGYNRFWYDSGLMFSISDSGESENITLYMRQN
jgi:hypothetical protein